MDGRENYSCIQGLSHSNQLYISASSSMSVTVSGSPTMRKLLFGTSLPFQNLQCREIPIRGPYHARHLFKQSDVEKIIDADIIRHLNQYSLTHPIVGLSTSTAPSSTIELFQQAVIEVLMRPVHWDVTVKNCVADIRSAPVIGVRVLAMGPTALSNSLVSALKVGGGLHLSLEDGVSWFAQNRIPKSVSGDMRNAKIAIVGMAGRFPNAADHEAYWKLLEQGLDVHREVRSPFFSQERDTDLFRFLRIGLMLKPTTILQERARTRVILHSAVSSTIPDCSILDSSTCPHVRPCRQIQCSD
jgi:hypothetical protein